MLFSRRAMVGAAGGTLAAGLVARQGRAAALGQLAETPPEKLPEFSFTDGDGKAQSLEQFAGKGLLINLWATWCGPCVQEMPALDRAQAALAAEDILVLPLSSDRGGKPVVQAFYHDKGIQRLGLWLDPRGAAGRALGVRGLPTTLVVDRNGQARARLEGAAEWDSATMLAAVRRLVAVPERPQPA